MAEKKIDSSILDRAIVYAVTAHKNTERRGKGFPYVVHPLEAVSIVATMTNDQEILAAAALHDVVEDTEYTITDIEKEFGKRVASLVSSESDNLDRSYSKNLSWKEIKVLGFKRIKNATKDEQMVALGDKLSNMRAIYHDWMILHDKIFLKFHEQNPSIHAWRYYQLCHCFDKLEGEPSLEELKLLVRLVFGEYLHDFKIEKNEKILKIYGKIDENSAFLIKDEINSMEGDVYLDFSDVAGIDNAAIRVLYQLSISGKRFYIRNANINVIQLFYATGVYNYIPVTEQPREILLEDYEESGDGYTAVSYNHKDGDLMMKLYADFIRPEEVEKEKVIAERVLSLGINTPFCDGLVSYKGQQGITFERIKGKRSIARAISQEPDKLDYFMERYTHAVKDLHSRKCDTTLFEPISISFLRELEIAKEHFTSDEYKYIRDFIYRSNEGMTGCIHGDLHIGNVLITEKSDVLFIDLADFCYGNPLYDVSTFYVMSHIIGDDRIESMFHITKPQIVEAWKAFVKKYYGVYSDDQIQEIENKIKPYAGIRIIQFANRSKWRDGGIADNLKKLIFGK